MSYEKTAVSSNLALNELGEKELNTIVGGNEALAEFENGFLLVPDMIYAVFTGRSELNDGQDLDRGTYARGVLGIAIFVAIVEAAFYGLYKGGCWALGKAKASINKKPANKPLDNKKTGANKKSSLV